ncbi:facilitated trehalose transporter Tret1-like isoform X2 [Contarinia nasturtii]|uniref:facilitated trehalose transporter Tret1-like isoform X2 n=1 Tax=Contarinia nasturtii TaxID=265458 RepID=UPI0012D3AB11|nr:facilitated trehalose transporter Tret1-like isoform X2 [Contarinia nasturtii]
MDNKVTQVNNYQCKNVKNQYIAAVAANIIFLGHGSMNGWLSPALPLLLSESTPLKTGVLTNEMLSWLGSISALAGLLGTFMFGFIITYLGCKRSMLLLSIPCLSFWALVFFGDTYYHLLLARFFNGITGGGIQSSMVLYISEIANNNIRGRLNSISHMSRNIGILGGYILGAILQYKTIPCVFAFVPIVFSVWFYYLPNTPQFYLQKSQLKRAEDSLKFYKGLTENNVNEAVAFNAEFERLKSIAKDRKMDEKTPLNDIFEKHALKGIMNGIILSSLAHLSGFLVFITYAAHIFEQVGASQVDPYISSIAIAVVQLIGTLCTTRFSDSMGRKALLIISLLGSAFGHLSFASYSYLSHNGYELSAFEWVPVVSLSFVIFIASSGVVPLMFLCMAENLPSKVRTIGVTVCNVFMNLVSFACLKLFPVLMATRIGLHGCMIILATFCICGSLYVHFVVKETKGFHNQSNKLNMSN